MASTMAGGCEDKLDALVEEINDGPYPLRHIPHERPVIGKAVQTRTELCEVRHGAFVSLPAFGLTTARALVWPRKSASIGSINEIL